MRQRLGLIVVLASLSLLAGCEMNVRESKVYGTYVASYPYGTETITFNSDHTFIQSVVIEQEKPAVVRGNWEFDSKHSRVSYTRALLVDDGFGGLRPDWRSPTNGWTSMSVEMHWFRIVIGSGLPFPYVKR
jgi:hypothetical protein